MADHLMGWTPESIWTPDLIKSAAFQKDPHIFHEVYSIMAVAAWNTSKVLLGTSVTETFRRHPADLAQTLITQDNISKGRVILGIGTGEGENVIPYGIKWDKPVSRLEESIKIIKLLWESDKKVDYEGEFWKLKDAVLTIKPFEKDEWVVENLLKDEQFRIDLKEELYSRIEPFKLELMGQYNLTEQELEVLIDGYIMGYFDLPPDTPEWARELLELS